jgi:hypothetical protein
MKAGRFNEIFQDTVNRSRSVLVRKAGEYADENDRLHNFKQAAHLQATTQRITLGGFMAKHLVSVYDLIRKEECASLEVWDEKILDSINYLILLRAAVIEELEGTN